MQEKLSLTLPVLMITLYHLVYELCGCVTTKLTFGEFRQITTFFSNEIQNVQHDDGLNKVFDEFIDLYVKTKSGFKTKYFSVAIAAFDI